MGSFESVLSWCLADGGNAPLKAVLLALGFVLLVFAVSGFWYAFFKMTAARSRRTPIKFPPINETPSTWSTWTTTTWYIHVLDSNGNPTHKEGPFYDFDTAIARCTELNAKHQ